jgi:hypothetical protein
MPDGKTQTGSTSTYRHIERNPIKVVTFPNPINIHTPNTRANVTCTRHSHAKPDRHDPIARTYNHLYVS